MIKSYYRGHEIILLPGVWVYADNNKKVGHNKNRNCGYCGLSSTPEKHDGCLGKLDGFINACCGHGNIKEAYVQYPNGFCVRGKEAVILIERRKKEARRDNR